jgi:hypothetical protein
MWWPPSAMAAQPIGISPQQLITRIPQHSGENCVGGVAERGKAGREADFDRPAASRGSGMFAPFVRKVPGVLNVAPGGLPRRWNLP